uniref:Uncharacterized protein n=1 Tax=Leptospira ellisii TaxID=2023197 RepID=A0A2N0B856_9LEPT|nr:hypothetical protein CH379_11675 [Leptospira ellisii]
MSYRPKDDISSAWKTKLIFFAGMGGKKKSNRFEIVTRTLSGSGRKGSKRWIRGGCGMAFPFTRFLKTFPDRIDWLGAYFRNR